MKGLRPRIGQCAWRVALLPMCAALAACGGSAAARQTQATVPDTTIPPINSYAVPPHITAAYVQRVLNALDKVDGDATRLIVANRSLIPAAIYRLKAIDSDPWFTEVSDTWADQLAQGLKGYRLHPGEKKEIVEQVISATPVCVFAKVLTDYSQVSTKVQHPQTNYLQLIPLPVGRDSYHYNVTPWLINVEGYNSQGLVPGDPCAAS